jgi:hypothetical protein
MPLDKLSQQSRQIAISKGHVALLILFLENNVNASNYLTKFLNQLNLLTEKTDEGKASLKIVAEGIQEVFLGSDSHFENGEELFIGEFLAAFYELN